MKYDFLTHHIIENNDISNALCLWSWTWYECLIAASFWLDAVAIDNQSEKNWTYPEHLQNHPKIKFHATDIESFLKNTNTKYDLIVMFNIIHLLQKDYVISELRADLSNHLNNNWNILFNFFTEEDSNIKNTFNIEDFILPNWLKTTTNIKTNKKDNHPPLGIHIHHIQYSKIIKQS